MLLESELGVLYPPFALQWGQVSRGQDSWEKEGKPLMFYLSLCSREPGFQRGCPEWSQEFLGPRQHPPEQTAPIEQNTQGEWRWREYPHKEERQAPPPEKIAEIAESRAWQSTGNEVEPSCPNSTASGICSAFGVNRNHPACEEQGCLVNTLKQFSIISSSMGHYQTIFVTCSQIITCDR